MRVLTQSFDLTAPSGPPRTAGVHASRIIRNLAILNKTLKGEILEDLSLVEVAGQNERWWESLTPVDQLRISMGLAWENWYLPRREGIIHQPGELELDGIYMTPDGESLDIIQHNYTEEHILCLHECKVTYKSCRRLAIETQWMWMAQMKAYCKAMNALRAFLHVLFVCGDYSFPQRPRLGPVEGYHTVYQIDYTQEELDDNWDVIRTFARHYAQLEREAQMRDTVL